MNENNNFALIGFGFLLGILLKDYSNFNFVNTSAQVVLAFAALIALYQITLSKKDIENRSKRESINLAIDKIEFFRLITEKVNQLNSLKISLSAPIVPQKLNNYFYSEIKDDPTILAQYRQAVSFCYVNGQHGVLTDIGNLTFGVTNDLELFACTFIEGGANKEIAFNPCAKSFCQTVEWSFHQYCYFREKGKVNYYENTIKLYNLWSNQVQEAEKNFAT